MQRYGNVMTVYKCMTSNPIKNKLYLFGPLTQKSNNILLHCSHVFVFTVCKYLMIQVSHSDSGLSYY